MKSLLPFLCFLSTQLCSAQQVVDVNHDVKLGSAAFNMFIVNGTPFVNTKFVRLVEGTPYFSDDWMKGVLVGEDEVVYKGLSVKLDLIDNKILYKDATGNELVTSTPLKELVLTNAIGNEFKFVHINSAVNNKADQKNSWYLWMASGTASLYKYFDKSISEQKPYNSATFEQSIKTMARYMVFYNNSLLPIKKIKDAPDVLADKKMELQNFLTTKDDKNKSMDNRMMDLIAFYNALFK